MFKDKKKIIALCLACAVFFCIMGANLAYFTDWQATSDKGSVGTVAVALDENINLLNEAGQDILDPGDMRNVSFTVTNMGNKSIDTKTTVAITVLGKNNELINFSGDRETQSQFDLYLASDVEKINGRGYAPKDGAKPIEGKNVNGNVITYTLPASLNGNSEMYDECETIAGIDVYSVTYDFVLLFSKDATDEFQGGSMMLDILTEAKQHMNTEAGWEMVASQKIAQGAIAKEVGATENNITNFYYPFTVGYDEYNRLTLTGVVEGVDLYALTSATIPYGVQVIPEEFFMDCTELKNITSAPTVTHIYNSAFENSGITKIKIPDSVTHIGHNAFRNCENLKNVKVGSGITSIYSYVFAYCDALTNVEFSENIKTLNLVGYMFYDCDGLTSVKLPNGTTSVPNGCFYMCDNLTEVILPDTITSIGSSAFYSCDKLESVNIPNGVTKIANNAFENCVSLTEAIMPDTITSISNNVFSGCTSLQKVKISNNITSIPQYAFAYCEKLENVVIPEKVTTIGTQAFRNCNSLTEVTIPKNVTKINDGAVFNCKNLTNIIVANGNTAYKAINGVLYTIDEKTLIQYPVGRTDTTFTIPNTVTTIGYGAFSMGNDLIEIIIPEGVTDIGKYAFQHCDNLTGIILPYSITVISDYMLKNCGSLESIVIPDSVITIGTGAFQYCDKLVEITIPDSVTTIGNNAFTTNHFSSSKLDTTIYTNNSVAKNYKWSNGNRTPVFVAY